MKTEEAVGEMVQRAFELFGGKGSAGPIRLRSEVQGPKFGEKKNENLHQRANKRA